MDASPTKDFLYESLATDLTGLIASGTFRPGDRLPSVRKLSTQRKVSVSTVLQAYMLLEDRGLIEVRPQSGYYVRMPDGQRLSVSRRIPLPEPEISSPEPDPAQVGLRELVMMITHDTENRNLVQLGTAIPNPDLLPTQKLARIAAHLSREHVFQSNQIAFPPGCEVLRVQIAQRALVAGCSLSPADIITTTGCSEALQLCLRAACRPGDIVAIESPTYFGILQIIEALGLKALEIPTHPRDGISLGALRFALEHNPVRACLVVSNFNNPLGSCMSDDNKRELVELLAQHEIPLIEDDISGEIYFTEQRPPVAKAFDRNGLVMLCSSFSKDIGPGYRVGWAAPGRYRSTVEWLKLASSVASATLPQLAVADFIACGGYDHHLRRLRREYAFNVEQMTQAVVRCFPEGTRVTRPAGGFVLWVQLPETVDSLELYRQALKVGVTLAPGYIFSASQKFRNFIRLNAAVWSKEVERAIGRLGELVDQEIAS
jgi:DNA-binding transcriptional MocR family regulator